MKEISIYDISYKQLRDVVKTAKNKFLANDPNYQKHANTLFSRQRFKTQVLIDAAEIMANRDKPSLLQAISSYLERGSNEEQS